MTLPVEHARRDAQEESKLEAALREMFESTITFNRTLGLKVLSCDPLAPKIGEHFIATANVTRLGARVGRRKWRCTTRRDC